MGVRYKLTRAQLVALGPCREGLTLFDELAPRGVVATKKPERAEEMARRSPEYAQWIGNVLPTQEGARFGSGSGSGYGYGDGDGYGYGYGYGDGDGYGYGSVTSAGARVLQDGA